MAGKRDALTGRVVYVAGSPEAANFARIASIIRVKRFAILCVKRPGSACAANAGEVIDDQRLTPPFPMERLRIA